MMPWYKISLSVDDVVNRLHCKIQDEFEIIFKALGAPKDMALFSSTLKPDYESVDLYFTPEAAENAKTLLDKYAGKECEKPSGFKPVPLVGHEGTEKIFFD